MEGQTQDVMPFSLDGRDNNLVKYRLMLMRNQHLYESPAIEVYGLQITMTLTESALLIFLQSGVEKLLAWVPGD